MSKQKQVVAIRHVAFEDLGVFAEPLDAAGYSIRYLEPGDLVAEAAQAAKDADLLVVLGGPIGVYEDSEYPFLAAEIAIIAERLASMRPVLGVCLGAQLMARALGAPVFPGQSGKEIGWHPIELTDDGRNGPLRHLAGIHVLHWHGDTFSLPPLQHAWHRPLNTQTRPSASTATRWASNFIRRPMVPDSSAGWLDTPVR